MDAADEISGGGLSDQHFNIVDRLYAPCLKWATKYVRDAGYFGSQVYRAMDKEMLDFVLRDKNNHITLLINVDVQPSDYDAIVSDISRSEEQVFKELREMLEDDVLKDPVKMLASIIAVKQMTVYVSLRDRPSGSTSIDHSKTGYFTNGEKTVYFDGSFNETYPATIRGLDKGHKEHFHIYADWETDAKTWRQHVTPFIKRLDDDCSFPIGINMKESSGKGTIIVKIEEIDRSKLPTLKDEDWDPENHKKRAAKRSANLYKEFEKKLASKSDLANDVDEPKTGDKKLTFFKPPSINLPQDLYKHQKKGINAWKNSGKRGILEHATGSGKTITAISAIKEHVESGSSVIVLVPSEPLLLQWEDEIEEFLPHISLGLLGGGNSDKSILSEMRVANETGSILLSTIQSFRNESVLGMMERLLGKKSSPILLVIDECHKIGGPSYSTICEKNPHATLGLSATPKREGDSEGTDRLIELLGPIIDVYSLQDALDDGRLCPYDYHVHTATLEPDEQHEYDELREKMRKSFVRMKRGDPIPDPLKMLIYKSRGIIRGARQKIPKAVNIVKSEYEEGQHWLIYCENSKMMEEIRTLIKDETDISPLTYWSKMDREDRKLSLAWFEKNGGVMLAIKCLDEGVDIPAISHGIVLASSKTEREWIQRRGRLLRKSKNKPKSIIHDVLALPGASGKETSFVFDEVARAIEFSKAAKNSRTVSYDLGEIAEEYNLNIEDLLGDTEDQDG